MKNTVFAFISVFIVTTLLFPYSLLANNAISHTVLDRYLCDVHQVTPSNPEMYPDYRYTLSETSWFMPFISPIEPEYILFPFHNSRTDTQEYYKISQNWTEIQISEEDFRDALSNFSLIAHDNTAEYYERVFNHEFYEKTVPWNEEYYVWYSLNNDYIISVPVRWFMRGSSHIFTTNDIVPDAWSPILQGNHLTFLIDRNQYGYYYKAECRIAVNENTYKTLMKTMNAFSELLDQQWPDHKSQRFYEIRNNIRNMDTSRLSNRQKFLVHFIERYIYLSSL